jgi:hypothetical protein
MIVDVLPTFELRMSQVRSWGDIARHDDYSDVLTYIRDLSVPGTFLERYRPP